MAQNENYVCPDDKGVLLHDNNTNSAVCSVCKKSYPTVNGILSFIDFSDGNDPFSSDTFSLEWTYFSFSNFRFLDDERRRKGFSGDVGWENFDFEKAFFETTGLSKDELKGKRVLEVGVGSGRLISVALKYGAECYGIDYSNAVFIANKELRSLSYQNIDSRLHLCQADLFKLPFEDQFFDYIYSIGVLHHTPDTRAAFDCLPRLLKKGGKLSIWVYPEYNVVINYNIRFWRKVFQRLPFSIFFRLCKILGSYPIAFLYRKIKMLHLLMHLPSADSVNYKDRVRVILDYYSPTYLNEHSYFEVFNWFKEHGFTEIEVLKQPISFIATKG